MKLFLACLLLLLVPASTFSVRGSRGCRMVNCYMDPCKFATCAAFPEAKCIPNYCGGCNPHFYVNRKRVTCDAKKVSKSVSS